MRPATGLTCSSAANGCADRHVPAQKHRQCQGQIVGIETPEQPTLQLTGAPARIEPHAQTVGAQLHLADVQISIAEAGDIRTAADRQREGTRTHLSGQIRPDRIIHIDHRQAQPGNPEQARLGIRIGLHAAVIVLMITTQIGEYRGMERHTGDAVLVQRM